MSLFGVEEPGQYAGIVWRRWLYAFDSFFDRRLEWWASSESFIEARVFRVVHDPPSRLSETVFRPDPGSALRRPFVLNRSVDVGYEVPLWGLLLSSKSVIHMMLNF